MSNIYVGDTPTYQFTVKNNGQVVDIRGATVEITLIEGVRKKVKNAILTDAINGGCELELTADDLSEPGMYFLQGVVKLQNGKTFASDKVSFGVNSRI